MMSILLVFGLVGTQAQFLENSASLGLLKALSERRGTSSLKLPIPSNANLKCVNQVFPNNVTPDTGERGISLAVNNHLPFVVQVSVAGRDLCTGGIINSFHVLAPTSCCIQVDFFGTTNVVEFATQSGPLTNNGYRHLHKENSEFCTIELNQPILWSELAKPVCLPFLDDHSFPMHCWALTVQKDDAKQYGTKYAPLTPCENNEIGEYCTETFSCKEKRDMGDTLLCLGPDNNIEIHGFMKRCENDVNIWSSITKPQNYDYIISTAMGTQPTFGNQLAFAEVGSIPEQFIQPNNTFNSPDDPIFEPVIIQTVNKNSQTVNGQTPLVLSSLPKTPFKTPVRPVNQPMSGSKQVQPKVNLQCMRCSGKDFKTCNQRGKMVTCAKYEVCMTSVRKRNNKILHVLKDCKQTLACLNMKRHNFNKNRRPNQCRPWAPRGPSVCRQCCAVDNLKCKQTFWADSMNVWRNNYLF